MTDRSDHQTSGGNGYPSSGFGPGADASSAPPGGIPTLVDEAVDVFDSVVEYAAALSRLQVFHVRAAAVPIAIRAGVLVAAGILVLVGILFVSVGVALGLAGALHSLWAGFLIVGAVWVLVALIAAIVGTKARFGATRAQDERARTGSLRGDAPNRRDIPRPAPLP